MLLSYFARSPPTGGLPVLSRRHGAKGEGASQYKSVVLSESLYVRRDKLCPVWQKARRRTGAAYRQEAIHDQAVVVDGAPVGVFRLRCPASR